MTDKTCRHNVIIDLMHPLNYSGNYSNVYLLIEYAKLVEKSEQDLLKKESKQKKPL